MHRFAMGALRAALCLGMSLISGPAAAKKMRGACIIAQQPVCLPLWYPKCTPHKTSCGGCLKWVCTPIFPH